MFRYYYENKLVRTSETHGDYRFCVVLEMPNGDKRVKNCSSKRENLERHVDHFNKRYNGIIKVYIDELTME